MVRKEVWKESAFQGVAFKMFGYEHYECGCGHQTEEKLFATRGMFLDWDAEDTPSENG
jgi:hypothetical protein